jgi:hypothetical protein
MTRRSRHRGGSRLRQWLTAVFAARFARNNQLGRISASIAVLGMVAMTVGLYAVTAAPSSADGALKVWVCKYSSTPDVSEKAQTVNSVKADEFRQVPGFNFQDAQSLSYVYGYSTGPDAVAEPTVDQCPVLMARPGPTFTDPTCSTSGSYDLGAYDHEGVDVTETGDTAGAPGGQITITYTPKPNYYFVGLDGAPPSTDPISISHTYTTPTGCVTKVTPVAPTVTEPACNGPGTSSDGSVALPADTAAITYSYDKSTHVVTATLTDASYEFGDLAGTGYTLSSGGRSATYQVTFTDPGACLVQVGVPTPPEPVAPTCSTDGSLTVAPSEHVVTSVNGEVVTASTTYGPGSYTISYAPAAGYTFADGVTTSFDRTVKTATEDCGVVLAAPIITQSKACDSAGTVSLPADGGGVSYVLDPNNGAGDIRTWSTLAGGSFTVTATTSSPNQFTATAGWVLSDGNHTATWTGSLAKAATCTSPVRPTITEPTCLADGSFTLPTDGDGISYTKNGDVVTASLADGYEFAGDLHGYTVSADGRSATFTVTYQSPTGCVLTAPTVSFTDPSCANQNAASYQVSGFDPATMSETVVGTATPGTSILVSFAPLGHYTFGDGAQTDWSHQFGQVQDCRALVSPVAPSLTEPACTGPGSHSDGSVTLADGPDGVSYSYDQATQTVTATTDGGHKFDASLPTGWTRVSDTEATYYVAFTDPGDCLVQVAPGVSFTDDTCVDLGGAAVSTDNADQVDYVTSGTVAPGGTVTVTASPKAGYVFADGATTTWTHTFPSVAALGCVKGTQTSRPHPHHPKPHHPKPNHPKPTVKGTQAVAPTAVDAGLPGPGSAGTEASGRGLSSLGLVAGGMVMLAGAGWIGLGRRRRGVHEV